VSASDSLTIGPTLEEPPPAANPWKIAALIAFLFAFLSAFSASSP